MPNDENNVEETTEETAEETAEEITEETAEETAEETVTIGEVMDAIRALDERLAAIATEIADLKSIRIESGAEYTDGDGDGIGDADDDPEPRSIDELDLTI